MELLERQNVNPDFCWDITHLYKDKEAFDADVAFFRKQLEQITENAADFTRDADHVGQMLDLIFDSAKRVQRLHSYAERVAHQDVNNSYGQALEGLVMDLLTQFAAATSFESPALLALPEEEFTALLTAAPTSKYRHYLEDIGRSRPHIGSAGEEAIMAEASRLAQGPEKIYSTFCDGEMPFPNIEVDGKTEPFSKPLFAQLRLHPDQETRKRAFATMFGTYGQFENTLAATLVSQLQNNIFNARVRHYPSALAAALDGDNINPRVYEELIKAINRHLPLLHRYLKLRKKALHLETLNYHDLYLPIAQPPCGAYTYEEGCQLIKKALAILGPDYIQQLSYGLDPAHGWVDIYPNRGKLSGAYMSGSAYDVHPYVLLNYIGDYDAVSTVAHEFGHAMHSYYSNKNQPFHQSDYSIFIAEIASTFNELLLIRHLLKETTDKVARLALLGEVLESFRTTVFRQAMFAEFELAIHQTLEAGSPLTAEILDEKYLELVKRYYGSAEGLVAVDEVISHEWAYIPHFYYNFYVYQYATGLLSAVVLADMVEKEGPAGRERYLNLLKSGAADYPQKLLETAGVDLTAATTYDGAMSYFAKCLEEAEELI